MTSISTLRRHGLQLALAAGLSTAALGASAAPSYDNGRPDAEAVTIGMTLPEVQQVLGRGHEITFRGSSAKVWNFETSDRDGPKVVSVTFDSEGKVAGVSAASLNDGP